MVLVDVLLVPWSVAACGLMSCLKGQQADHAACEVCLVQTRDVSYIEPQFCGHCASWLGMHVNQAWLFHEASMRLLGRRLRGSCSQDSTELLHHPCLHPRWLLNG